jgi:NTP pyrophosphatase (non-canonical NTP hydrolase)
MSETNIDSTPAPIELEKPEVQLDVINRGEYSRRAQSVADVEFYKKEDNAWTGLRLIIGKTHHAATAKGWWDKTTGNVANIVEGRCFRVISELVEGWEETRKPNLPPNTIYWKLDEHGQWKPEGLPIELADAVIRLFDLAAYFGIDLADAIRVKMAFNDSRPFMHGGKQA